MGTITESIDVDVDVSTAYNQWTQFESFPEFMDGVDEVRQLDDTHLHWVTSVGPATREFDATVTEQHPDERVAWKSDDGPEHAGVVTFHRLDDQQTKVTVQMSIDPDGLRRERRGQGQPSRPSRQGRPGAVQGVHREPGHRDRRVARGRRLTRYGN